MSPLIGMGRNQHPFHLAAKVRRGWARAAWHGQPPPVPVPDGCRSARPTRLGLPWSPSSPSPTTNRVVVVPTGEAAEGKV